MSRASNAALQCLESLRARLIDRINTNTCDRGLKLPRGAKRGIESAVRVIDSMIQEEASEKCQHSYVTENSLIGDPAMVCRICGHRK